MIYRVAALIALSVALPVIAAEPLDLHKDDFKKEKKIESCCQIRDFKFNIHGQVHFSLHYAKNKDYFKIAKGAITVDVLTKDGDILQNNQRPSEANGVKKISDGGVIGNYTSPFGMGNVAKVTFDIKNKINDDAVYGATAEIKFDDGSLKNSYAYMFLDTLYGRFEGGNYKSSAEIMKLDASSIATIDGGIDNDWVSYANVEGQHINAHYDKYQVTNTTRHRNVLRTFYPLPYLYTAHYRNYVGGKHNVKATYYSSEYSGLKFGVSYTANEGGIVPFNDNRTAEKGDYKNVISGGILYENNFENLKYQISATGEKSLTNENSDKHHDLLGFNIGSVIEYAGFKLAGSFANLFKSGLAKKYITEPNLREPESFPVNFTKPTNPGNTTYWTLGGAYEAGPAMVSITYLNSKTDPFDKDASVDHENILKVVSLGTHYNISGKRFKFTPYTAFNYFTTKEGDVHVKIINEDKKNQGYVFLTGIKVVY